MEVINTTEMTNERFDLNQVQQLEANFVMPTYARQPVLFVGGTGATLFDDKGQAYLDFISGIGVNVLGYDHPRVRRVLNEQAALPHTSNLFYHPYQGQLAKALVEASGLAKVFFCNTGTEATEGALKAARAWQRKRGRENKTEYISLHNSFHGRSMGALSITAQKKYREPFEPLIPGVSFIHANDHEEAKTTINERTAAVIVETIQGEGGIRLLTPEYLQTLRDACDAVDALLIVDEVQCGLGRTGKLFAYQHSDVKPDILTVAKPLGLGVPLGAIVFNEKAADGFKPGDHGSTFGGGPLACRLSLEFMHELNEGNLMARVNETGAYFKQQLQQLQESHPDIIKDVRAIGLMVGAELTFPGKNVPGKMLARGFVMNCTNETTLRFLPPYIIRNDEIDAMLTTLEEVIVEEAKEI
jgi:acetylornithine aminotransferase/acetylornithine/N-succinyldiaminopimelate aminotransferase